MQTLNMHAIWIRYIWAQGKMLTFGKQKYYFLNRVKYIEVSLMKSSGKIYREH